MFVSFCPSPLIHSWKGNFFNLLYVDKLMIKVMVLAIPLTLSGCFNGRVNDLEQEKLFSKIQAKGFDSLNIDEQYIATHGLHGIENPHNRDHILRLKAHLRTRNNPDE